MTITNGGSQGRVVEHVEGVIGSSNPRGVKLVGEDDYRNFSKYADPPIAPPSRGARVRLGLDGSAFVRELEVVDSQLSETDKTPALLREERITKLAVLKAAANFLGQMSQTREEVRSDHVLVLADKWLAWVKQNGDDDTD